MAADKTPNSALLHNVGVHTAYGDPVVIDGTTIVPVAAAGFLFGSGSGDAGELNENTRTQRSGEIDASGNATAGGGYAFPVGAYVTRDGYTKFEPNVIAVAAIAIPLVCVAGSALARVVRALKK